MKSFNQHQPHPFHLVEPSPWPLGISVALLVTTVGAVMKFQGYSDGNLLSIGLIGIILSMGLWWRDCIRESTYEGSHTSPVQRGMMIGFILFLLSEVLFFFSIFWGYFHSSLAPSVELGSM